MDSFSRTHGQKNQKETSWRKIPIALKTPLCGSKREIAWLQQPRSKSPSSTVSSAPM